MHEHVALAVPSRALRFSLLFLLDSCQSLCCCAVSRLCLKMSKRKTVVLSLKDKITITDSLQNGENGRKLADKYLVILRKYVLTYKHVSLIS